MISAEESAPQLSASDELVQTVRNILQKSIQTIREAGSYSTTMSCKVEIMGKTFNGKGEYKQKRQKSESVFLGTEETVFAFWEMTFYLPDFKFTQTMKLNGKQELLLKKEERQAEKQEDSDEKPGEIQVVNLAFVRAAIEKSPLEYTSITPPWYSQPNVAKILEGILESFLFTMGGETQFVGSNQSIYLIQGQLKPELTREILESRGLDPTAGLAALPGEVPTEVELMIDKVQGLPIQIRFYRKPSEEKKDEIPEETFSYTILFEQTHLNDVSLDDSFFEISRGYEMHDVTEQYLKDHHN